MSDWETVILNLLELAALGVFSQNRVSFDISCFFMLSINIVLLASVEVPFSTCGNFVARSAPNL